MNEQNLPLPPELGHLSSFIDSNIECLVGPSSELRSIALHATKHIFDWALQTEKSSKPHIGTLLATLTEVTPPQTRSQARRITKRRRSPSSVTKPQKKIDTRETPLPSLFIEGMNIDQIWQQLDLRATRVCENLRALLGEDGEGENLNLNRENSNSDEDEAEEMDIDGEESIWEELSDEEEDDSSTTEGVDDLRDETSEDDEDERPLNSMLDVVRPIRLRPSGENSDLDDGFFNLATFNAETNEPEAKEVHKSKPDFVTEEDSTEESEVDFFASVDDPAAESVGDGYGLFYNDFFDPPPRVQNGGSIRSSKVRFHERVAVKKIKAVGKGMPVSSMNDEDSDEDEDDSSCDGS